MVATGAPGGGRGPGARGAGRGAGRRRLPQGGPSKPSGALVLCLLTTGHHELILMVVVGSCDVQRPDGFARMGQGERIGGIPRTSSRPGRRFRVVGGAATVSGSRASCAAGRRVRRARNENAGGWRSSCARPAFCDAHPGPPPDEIPTIVRLPIRRLRWPGRLPSRTAKRFLSGEVELEVQRRGAGCSLAVLRVVGDPYPYPYPYPDPEIWSCSGRAGSDGSSRLYPLGLSRGDHQ